MYLLCLYQTAHGPVVDVERFFRGLCEAAWVFEMRYVQWLEGLLGRCAVVLERVDLIESVCGE